jgi:hypothetical protein
MTVVLKWDPVVSKFTLQEVTKDIAECYLIDRSAIVALHNLGLMDMKDEGVSEERDDRVLGSRSTGWLWKGRDS